MVTGCSCDGTVSSQGVLHVWPWVVRTSAPSGSDSNFNVWSCSDEEFDDSAEEQPVSETPTAAATTTESAMRDMTSLLPIFCSAQLMKTLAQNVENAPIASPEAPIKFATRKMASVGAQGGVPQIFGLCCFLNTLCNRDTKLPGGSRVPDGSTQHGGRRRSTRSNGSRLGQGCATGGC